MAILAALMFGLITFLCGIAYGIYLVEGEDGK